MSCKHQVHGLSSVYASLLMLLLAAHFFFKCRNFTARKAQRCLAVNYSSTFNLAMVELMSVVRLVGLTLFNKH